MDELVTYISKDEPFSASKAQVINRQFFTHPIFKFAYCDVKQKILEFLSGDASSTEPANQTKESNRSKKPKTARFHS